MAKDFETMEDSNRSSNPSIHDVSNPTRRMLLQGGAMGAVGALLAPLAACTAGGPFAAGPKLGFKGIAIGEGDKLVVPNGYVATAIAAWGEAVGIPGNMPPFKFDASNTAAEQAVQMGMHHDGMEYFPLDGSSTRGLMTLNHEYTDDGLLHVGGFAGLTAE
ncbi:MAG: alkaline phosphatase PhoX, partial [Burkholderiaceae bacterium]